MIITEIEAYMKDKVHLVHDLDYTVVDPEEFKREHAQKFQDVIIKERHDTKTTDVKLEITLLNMKEILSKFSGLEDQNKEVG